MSEAGLRLAHWQRRRVHYPRLSREDLNELVRIAGGKCGWSEDWVDPNAPLDFIERLHSPFADSGLEVRQMVPSLPYTVFNKDQSVTHTAIVENRSLGEVLVFIRIHQQLLPPAALLRMNGKRTGY